MKKKNVLDKFVTFFSSLDENEKDDLWGVLTALRGPDSNSELAKRYTTMRIRAELFNRKSLIDSNGTEILKGTEALVNSEPPEDAIDLGLTIVCLKEEKQHFLRHLKYAIEVLNERKAGCVDDVKILLKKAEESHLE